MILCDTSGLLAALDSSQRYHVPVRNAVQEERGPFLLSPFVLAELDYLLQTKVGQDAETRFLGQVAKGAFRLEAFGAEDVHRSLGIIERYADLELGLADASIVVLAARYRITRILTLDERHFRSVQPLGGGSFTLLPTDEMIRPN